MVKSLVIRKPDTSLDSQPTAEPAMDRPHPPPRLLRWIAPLALAVGVILLYWPTVGFEYVALDDTIYVATNRTVHRGLTVESVTRAFTDVRVGYWTPFLWISYMADVEVFGIGPFGFHLTNVLLHAIVAALFFLLLLELTGRPWPSLAAAALYSAHPLRVEAVAWVASRKDVLSMAFFLPAIFAYARYARTGRRRHYAIMAVLFIMGMMVKPVLMTLPFLLLALDVWPLGRTPFWDAPANLAAPRRSLAFLAVEKTPILAVSAAFAVSAMVLQGNALYLVEGDFSAWARAKMAMTSYVAYMRKTLWPVDLPLLEFALPYRVPSALTAVPYFILFCALTSLAIRWVRRQPWLTMAWTWYVIALLPVCGLAPAGLQWMADRFTYAPHLMLPVGLAFWASHAARRSVWRRRGLIAGTVAAVAVLSALSINRMMYWKDGLTLFSASVQRDPRDFLSRLQLGIALGVEKRLDEAEANFRKVIELNPYYVRGHYFLGMTYLDLGRYEEAAGKFSEVLDNDATFHAAHYMLAKALNRTGDPDGAERHLREYLRLEPDSDVAVDSLTLLGVVKASRGEIDEAMGYLGEALDREPLFPQAHYNLALALWAQGRDEEAEPHWKAALTRDPRLKAVFLKLTEEIEAEGRLEEAAAHIERFLQLYPEETETAVLFERLGVISLRMGDREGAVGWFRRAVERNPENLLFLLNLAENLYLAGHAMETIPLFGEIAAREPGSSEAAFAQGRLLLIEGKPSEAAAAFQVGLQSRPILASTPAALRRAMADLKNTEMPFSRPGIGKENL